jgi:uncharacterized protein (TIGR03435 family)
MRKLSTLLLLAALAACSKPAPQARPDLARKGEPAPRLALTGLLNAPVAELKNIEELKGKVVVLEFWATWCEPCVDSIPHLNALAEKYKDKPVVFISITDEPGDKVAEFLKTTTVKGWVAPEAPAVVFKAYRVFGRPHTVIIGRDSKVAAVTFPDKVTEASLNSLLAGNVPSLGGPAADNGTVAASSCAALAEFYIGQPAGEEMTSAFGEGYYAGNNYSLRMALENMYPGAEKIDTPGPGKPDLDGSRYDFRVRLPKEKAAGLQDFFAAGIERALGLKLKMVKKDVSVYVLKLAPGGLKRFKRSEALKSSARLEGDEFKAEKMPVSMLCSLLKDHVDLPVLDETGIKGFYDYTFRTGPRDLSGINSDLIDQFGLKLQKATRRIAVLEVR